jgi:hypothetical protein
MRILSVTLAALLLVCIVRFGRAGLEHLATLHLRGAALAFAAVLLQVAAARAQAYRLELLLLSAAPLATFCWMNRRRRGVVLIALGISLNMLVMALNGGAMPISPATLERQTGLRIAPGAFLPKTKDVVLPEEATILALLSDRLLLPGPLAPLAAWSAGDVLLIAGVGRLLWQTMKGAHDDRRSLWGETAVP